MSYKQRDLVIVKFPFTDLSEFKPRPALIISNSTTNITGDYTVLMITSKKINKDLGVYFDNNDLTIPLMPPKVDGYVYCKKVAVIDKSIISKKISSFNNIDKFKEIINIHIKGIEYEK
ncbi:type II toxin-antitoxin system PemK/MazF family toxin [Myroides odoratimimus]|uniref:type II toxin-antitoxin system PemK/MazF family toxin n=1 Tax=Myroides odoratimimus TaxID=76832 RepID=UPI000469D3A6|nr:type II toxin-antitoxin system PemK/MazF family toxin [Myroides odoratimimus]